ncbi:ABC-F family ATP-binding cassette domain-containing protein [Anaerostipes sp.]|uniref:ABC-F family ATP-binding cassette domain-containing protein n=1 Tax=Anaerostipes sp. TaxID=1872530 RepID=UPI002590E2E5|nr:ABC-F family ATP-binding cassette domain-containing protein [Anaerostipes sp.]MCI5622589.1 ABC-F family ATP-binding cassette domain-containing protein [Anaerostipes sp.]
MNILNIEHISKIYGEKVIFDDVSCGIHQGDKIGIIGVNGTGKTTLLKIIAGIEEPDLGQVICGNGISVAYLPQNPEFPKELTILEYVMEGKEHQDWKTESDAKSILTRLGIYDFESSTKYLSGGQKKRVALARTLVDPAEVLVLDEPTNHLDNDMVLWLEDYLNQFRGVLIMVTHDRYFLDRVTNKIVEIDKGKLYEYNANYSGFLELKVQREEMEQATERKRQSLLRVEMEWMKKGIKARGTRQRARTERFEALKNAAGPEIQQKVEMDSVSSRLGKKTIEIEHVSKGYDDKQLIQDFSYIILRDDRLGIIGPNGCGKSTLMKMIMGIVSPDEGQIIIGDTVKIGYFAQENEEMEEDKRVIDYIRDVADYIETARGKASASQMLERFLFPPALQYTPLNKLSGGEKRRLYLLRVLMEAPNVLILDEPTNDLDIATLTILEDYLDTFQGIVITVSHDRYFLDRIVNRIFAFESGGRLVQYEGGYTDYLEKTKDKFKQIQTKKELKDNKGTKFQKTHQKKLKFTFKEQKEFETIDEDIEKLETKIEQLDEEIMKNATNSGRLSELTVEKEETEAQLNEKMDRWVYLNDLAERIENQNL